MINKFNLAVILIFVVSNCYAQQKTKSDLYLYFKSDLQTYKTNHRETKEVIRNGKVVSPKYNYDVYTWQYFSSDKIMQRYRLMTVNKGNHSLKDSLFVRKNTKTFEQARQNEAIFYDSSDTKRFPFRKIFIAEYISSNEYKIVEVKSYMGSE